MMMMICLYLTQRLLGVGFDLLTVKFACSQPKTELLLWALRITDFCHCTIQYQRKFQNFR
jgi:hypothetical protein